MATLMRWLERLQNDNALDVDRLRELVIEKLKTVYDPEIPVNIYDLGLIYRIDIDTEGVIDIDMTLTAPGCPVAETFPSMVENAIREIDEVNASRVEIVWDPPWTQDRMTEAAKLELGMF